MLVPVSKAVDAVARYAIQESSKITSMSSRFLFLAVVGAARSNSAPIIANYAPYARAVGVLTPEGNVDTSALKNGLNEAFTAVPRVDVMGLSFGLDDAMNAVALMEQ